MQTEILIECFKEVTINGITLEPRIYTLQSLIDVGINNIPYKLRCTKLKNSLRYFKEDEAQQTLSETQDEVEQNINIEILYKIAKPIKRLGLKEGVEITKQELLQKITEEKFVEYFENGTIEKTKSFV